MNNYCRTEWVVDGMLSRGTASQSRVVYDCAEHGGTVAELSQECGERVIGRVSGLRRRVGEVKGGRLMWSSVDDEGG